MKKKVATTVLITTTLNGIMCIPIFATDNLDIKKITSNNLNVKNIDFLSRINARINYGDLSDARYKKVTYKSDNQHFSGIGFQSFFRPFSVEMMYGCISKYSPKEIELITGFFDIDGNLYHSDNEGRSSMGLKNISGDVYLFNTDYRNPYAKRGWHDVNGQKYFFDTTFRAKKGIHEILDKCYYYFNNQGQLQVGVYTIDGKKYNFTDKGGRAVLGWSNIGNNRYYFDYMQKGAAMEGWFRDPGGMVYFHEEEGKKGVMANGITEIDKDLYLFKTTGNGENAYRTYGFYTDQHTKTRDRYYFNPEHNGRAQTGWYTHEGKKMYFHKEGNNKGVMAKGVVNIPYDGIYLFLDSDKDWNAYQRFGWYTDPKTNNRYYFSKEENGRAVTGVNIIDGKKYVFSPRGVLEQ